MYRKTNTLSRAANLRKCSANETKWGNKRLPLEAVGAVNRPEDKCR